MLRICKGPCGEEKPHSEFAKDKHKKFGIRHLCQECFNLTRKSRSGCKKTSEYNKEYAKTRKYVYTEERKKYHATRYQENKDRLLDQNKQWRKDNPEKHREKEARRRARKLSATPHWLTGEQSAKIKRLYALAVLMEKITGVKYHVDHIIPLQGKNICGLHTPENLQVLRADLNLSKSNSYKE